jgi:hypothetical protein
MQFNWYHYVKEAVNLIEPLLRHAADFEETHLLAFDVYRRKGRLLLALRAANAAIKVAPASFAARRNVAHLAAALPALPAGTPAPVKAVLEEGVKALTGGKAAEAYADALVAEATTVLAAALAAEAVGAASGVAKGAAAAAAAAKSAAVEGSSVGLCTR